MRARGEPALIAPSACGIMALVRSRRWWSMCGLAAGLTICAACGDAAPVQRGFSSRQLFAIRDPSIAFVGWQSGQWTFRTRASGNEGGLEYWSLDLDTGAVRDLGPTLPQPMYPDPTPQRYSCLTSSDGPPWSASITDAQTGVTTTIGDIVDGWMCPSDADPTIRVWRQDGADRIALWTGPYDHLTQAPIALIVREIKDYEPAVGKLTGWRVFGSPLSDPDGVGLFSIDATTFAVTPIVAPTLDSAAWANGSTPEGPLDSSTLSNQFFLSLRSWRYIYARRMSDGSATLFAGPYPSDPVEVALLHLAPSSTLVGLPTYLEPTLLYSDPASGAAVLLSFNVDLGRFTACPSPFNTLPVVAQDATGSFTAAWGEFSEKRALLLIGPGTCQVLATDDVVDFGFSPDQTALAWLERPRLVEGTFWTAAVDGTGPRSLGGGTITDVPNRPRFFGSGADLQFQLGEDLVWMDVHDDPVRLHYIAEHQYGRAIDLGKWLLATYEYSRQDGTGRLALIERATGAKRLISSDVGAFESVAPPAYVPYAPPPLAALAPEHVAAGGYQFVYVVRGHNPSPQDGIWIASIPLSDLQ